MNKLVFIFLSLLTVSYSFAAEKEYKMIVAGFYNLENLFDTINDPNTFDDDFTPNGTNHYSSEIYLDKLKHLEEVVYQIGLDKSPDGLAFWGTAEIENAQVVKDLVAQPKLKTETIR